MKSDRYVGIDNDIYGGMTALGKLIRDAWVFEILPETETCENWDAGAFNNLMQKVNAEWDKYGCLASRLPEPLRERHARIFGEAVEKARAAGWSGESETDDET